MSTLKGSRDLWHPQTETDRELVLHELHSILESDYFRNSKRYPTFLQYVVERALYGQGHLIKERVIGTEVFGRSPDYDTNADTVVRYTAGEVRKRLALYYHDHEDTPVQIALPPGSYLPEFLHQSAPESALPEVRETIAHPVTTPLPSAPLLSDPEDVSVLPTPSPARKAAGVWVPRSWLIAGSLLCVLLVVLGFLLRPGSRTTDVERFWAPLFAEQKPILLGSGGVVFAPERVSGTITADKSTDYPFVSMQLVTAITRITGILERQHAEYEIRSAPFLTLTDMRERPTVLVGGYNNQWTMRLVGPLRFYFSPVPTESILDRAHPGVVWARDANLPYANADDYALICRFRDPTTDSLIFIVAGLGRNGTEAAAQFVSTPRYLEQLRSQAGSGWEKGNIEIVIKTKVIDGRTGAPSIVAVHTW